MSEVTIEYDPGTKQWWTFGSDGTPLKSYSTKRHAQNALLRLIKSESSAGKGTGASSDAVGEEGKHISGTQRAPAPKAEDKPCKTCNRPENEHWFEEDMWRPHKFEAKE